eukprot:CAMPEP_0183378278 /NCGR_PEP_ID=MMETSP0164_2-20130417/124829_1 /TAXON_ID=221442 /ORGANISM="Coccolithus pelagicus ssp braarudi, Strain PLY182g" /LENGTH=147 /DNA_ID=CAMNT_0025555829 /DNA_START=453 /DNA_END=897 /DNA_ORIENTATION=+
MSQCPNWSLKLRWLTPPSLERASLGEARLSASRLAQYRGAAAAEHNCLCVAEDSCYAEAAGTLDVHKEGVGRLHEPLQLVAAVLELTGRMQQINIAHRDVRHICAAECAGERRGWKTQARGRTAPFRQSAGTVPWSSCRRAQLSVRG